ncbi:MAG TPA: triose-phosphate isomerase [Candidatus Saccharimonadales bacterium]|nr:triose-phosphate isomerase [Candidatus Saccharimonadales bacterium]
MRKTLIVANWKMHLNAKEASHLVHELSQSIKIYRNLEVVLAPSLMTLQPLSLQIDRRKFRLAAQNAFYVDEGAYTGEVSFAMLRELAHYCIIGHSERRIYFNETLDSVTKKVAAAIRNDIVPIICIGDTKHEREAGETKRVLHDELTTALSDVTSKDIEKVVIAYEPTWAISTFEGEIPKPTEIESTIAYLRSQIADLYGQKAATEVRILYGGSVDEHSIYGYLTIKGCDGALVGHESLSSRKFGELVQAADRAHHEGLKNQDNG